MTFLISCGQNDQQKDNSDLTTTDSLSRGQTALSFDQYASKIKTIALPLDLKCDKDLESLRHDFDQSIISKYGQGNHIFGKIAETDKFTAIIYLVPADLQLPVIQTTDKEGNKISELSMYDRWCIGDPYSWGTSWASVSKDLTILLSDSAIIYKRDTVGGTIGEIIEDTKRTEVRHRVFKIDDTGQILEEKNGL